MSPYGGAVGASHAAIALPSVAGDVDDDIAAEIARVVSGGAAMQSSHAAGRQVQCGADADDSFDDVGECLVLVAVVQMPTLVVVVGQSGERRGRGKVLVEQSGSPLRPGFIDDGQPLVDHGADGGMITATGLRERCLHPVRLCTVNDAGAVVRPVVGQ